MMAGHARPAADGYPPAKRRAVAPPGFRLDGRVALITGGSSGIGLAAAKALGRQGAQIAIGSRSRERVSEAANELSRLFPGRVLGVTLDVTSDVSVQNAVMAVVTRFGALHIVVNSAGVLMSKAALEVTGADLNGIFDTNVTGSLRVAQSAARQFIRQRQANGETGESGCIVNIASINAFRCPVNVLGYAVTKAAVVQLTQGLANEWARYGIRTNALAPGFTPTDLNRHLIEGTDRGRRILEQTPMGRFAEADEMGGAVVYLASPAASFTNGVTLPVDGGWLVGGITNSWAPWAPEPEPPTPAEPPQPPRPEEDSQPDDEEPQEID
eukprot:TRINITY_DN65839_c0_g1_i1.p1 TRINITY_DN65839_c0_g1~~TRINITY_DN65839_c0_g1_i1.p1  ORF type:complete len:326 (+),score=87.63 TRINITY_DN65839_c0_g1_i1:93-1070(+)